MKINLFKNLPVAIACLSSAAAFAGMDMDSRVSQLEAQMKQVRTPTENDSFGAKTASAMPILENPYDFTLGLGAIYQTAVLGNTEFAYSDDDSSSALPVKGDLRESGDHWAWGINAMADYMTAHDGFDVKLFNSYFDTSSSRSVTAGFGGTVVPLRAVPGITGDSTFFDNCNEAKSNLKVGYDLLGLELGRSYYVSQYLSVRPSYGLLTSWTWLENKIAYSGGSDLATVGSVYVEDKSNWWGIGPEVGLESVFGIGKGFSFFGETKGALMYGRMKIEHEENYSNVADDNLEISAYGHRIVPYVQAIIGVSYDYTTDDHKNHIKLRAGYNTQFFFSANQMLRPSTQSSSTSSQEYFYRENNNLQVQGLILDASWSF